MKVLLIDDMRVPEMIRNPFSAAGARFNGDSTIVARTVEKGLTFLQDQTWDLLLLDHDMGEEKTGYDVMSWLEGNPEKCPKAVYLVTANPVGGMVMMLVVKKMYNAGIVKDYGWIR
jgi:CheY-like chemotaxis protein